MVLTTQQVEIGDDDKWHTKNHSSTNNKNKEESFSRKQSEKSSVSFVDPLTQNITGTAIQSASILSCSSSKSDQDQDECDDEFPRDLLDKAKNDSDDDMNGNKNEIYSIEEPAFYMTQFVRELPISHSIGTQQDASDLYQNEPRIKSRRILFAKTPADVFFELLLQSFWCEVV